MRHRSEGRRKSKEDFASTVLIVPLITQMQKARKTACVGVGLGWGRIKSPGQWQVGLTRSREGHSETGGQVESVGHTLVDE